MLTVGHRSSLSGVSSRLKLVKLFPKTETSFMKTVLSFFALLAASALCFSNVFAQADIQVHLPEGAKARIGKISIFGTCIRVRCCELLRDMWDISLLLCFHRMGEHSRVAAAVAQCFSGR